MKKLLPMLVVLAAAACVQTGDTSSVVQTGPTTLQAVQLAIFTPRCASSGCHANGGQLGLDLSTGVTMSNTIGVPSVEVPQYERITPFDAANSYLYMKVSGDPRILGDPMPLTPPLLNSQQLQLIEEWINAGALP